MKTSSLFATSCRLGAVLSGCSSDVVEAMAAFGSCIGLAFQISDDMLDFSEETELTGKGTGVDLRDGTVTLPLILAMELDESLAGLLEGEMDDRRVSEVINRVRSSGALEGARREAQAYVGKALESLAETAGSIDTAPLELIAAATVDRRI
jgi:geranylgeranyl pyrophosphate synthase